MDSTKITSFFKVKPASSIGNINSMQKSGFVFTGANSKNFLPSAKLRATSSKKASRASKNSRSTDCIQTNKLSLKHQNNCKKEISITSNLLRNATIGKHKSTDEESVNAKRPKHMTQKGQKSIFTYLREKDTSTISFPKNSVDDSKCDEKENIPKETHSSDIDKQYNNNNLVQITQPLQSNSVVFAGKGNLIVDGFSKLLNNTRHSDTCLTESSEDMFTENDFLDEMDLCFIEDSENQIFSNGKLDTWINNIDIDKEVEEDECFKVIDICHSQKGKIGLLLIAENSGVKKVCILQGFWLNTFVREGDTVRVLAEFTKGCATINDDNGLLVVNPHQLVSSTAVVSTLFCRRKTILAEKFPGWDAGNTAMLLGTLIHQLFQEVVQEREVPSDEVMEEKFCSILKKSGNQHSVYAKNSNEMEMIREATNYFPHIINWMKNYMNISSSSTKSSNIENDKVQVVSVVDIEDNIWCPQYGIRGKIDLTAEVTIHSKRKFVPIELKTGRSSFSFEHQGQVALYTMMMNYIKGNCNEGILLYLKDGLQMKAVSQRHSLQRDLVQLRNELAHYMDGSSSVCKESSGSHTNIAALPQPVNSKRSCQRCPFLLPCTIYQRTIEECKPMDTSHAMNVLIPETTNHLSSDHLDYFKHWCFLLQLEKQNSHSHMHQPFWKESSSQREKEGLCFARMSLQPPNYYNDVWWAERSYIHTFGRRTKDVNLLNVGLQQFDYITACVENSSKALTIATGEIIKITEEFVDVILDRNLYQKMPFHPDIYRLDKMISNSALSLSYVNLLRMMKDDSVSNRLRRLLIDRVSSTFVPVLETKLLKLPMLSSLNEQQFNSVMKVLSSQDYLLIKGMPGTGKTSTLVTLVRLLVEVGNSVLLTSYTHSALDNILTKLKEHNVDFIRLGRLSRIRNDIKPFSAEVATQKIPNVKELDRFYKAKQVVGTACLGINHPIFQHRNFDICIVDEASQVLQTACIGPLLHAKKFVLVGDAQQLPPVVQSKEARLLGMSESLFARLQTKQNTMELNVQYRMNKEIMRLCNALTYDGALKCGSPSVEYSTLCLPDIDILPDSLSWHKSVLSTRLCDAALFLNTDSIPATETYDSRGLVQNEIEMQIVTQLIWSMIKAGVSENDIGVITPYRRQVHLLQDSLNGHKMSNVEVNTVDQYQGRDKSVILISCVRSSTGSKIAELLEDERRLNVAVSRAKHKLLIIGSKCTLLNYSPFSKLIKVLREKQIINVPKDNIIRFWNDINS